MNIKNIDFKKYRIWFIPIAGFSLFWTVLGSITIDYRWWWLSFFSITLSSFTLALYKDLITENKRIHQRVRYILRWISIVTIIFLFYACFISLWWLLFGLIILTIILYTYINFNTGSGYSYLTLKEKQIITFSSIGFLLLLIGLFLIPSFFANNHKNPDIIYTPDPSTDMIYAIYGDVSPKDREHIITKSWYDNTPYYYVNDYVNVIWSNQKANNYRGNRKFKDLNKKTSEIIKDDGVIVGYRTDDYFMPTDEYKGDVARIMIYMYVTYKDNGLDTKYIDLNLMKKWSRQDPVDDREIDRNKAIHTVYRYNNRFVSNPWLIGFVV